MDIALKFKRAIASLSAGLIFSTLLVFGPSNASAHTFTDVNMDTDWGAQEIYSLVDSGVLDANDTFRKDDPILRGEWFKMVAEAGDFMAGCEQPATPTWTDAPAGRWDTLRAECLGQAGVVTGDTDPVSKLPIGTVRLADKLNRVEGIATVMRAFDIPTDLDPAAPFPDNSAEWYKNMVTSAYNAGIVKGDNGMLYPGRDMTRREAAVFLYRAMNPTPVCDPNTDPNCKNGVCDPNNANDPDCLPINCDPNDPNDPDCQAPPTSNGDLEVSLSAKTAKGTTLALGATHVELASFDFTAVGDDVYLTNLTIDRAGVGKSDDIDQLYLYEGAVRQTNGRTINSDNQAKFPLKFLIKKGQTRTLTVVGDIATDAGSNNEHFFSIADDRSVVHNGKSTKGTFSLDGNTFSIGGEAVNTVTVKAGPDPSDAELGEVQAELASIRLEVGSESDVLVKSLALNNAGSFDAENVSNLTLKIGDEVVAKADGLINDIVTFDLGDKPYLLKSGQNKTAYVLGDLTGGKDGETFIFYLENNVDAWILDNDFKQGATIDNQFTLSDANTVTVKGGDLVVADGGPAATQIPNDSQDEVLLNYNMTPAQDLTVRDTYVAITIQNPDGTTPTFNAGNTATLDNVPTLGGVCAANEYNLDTVANNATLTAADMFLIGNGSARVVSNDGDTSNGGLCVVSADDLTDLAGTETLTEVNPYSYLTDLEVFDADTDTSIAGPLGTVSGGTACTAAGTPLVVCPAAETYATVLGDDYDILAGKTFHASIRVDVEPEMVIGYQVNASVQFPDNSVKNEATNQFIDADDIVGAGNVALAGDFMTIAEDDLTVAVAANPSSQNFVKSAKADGLGFTLSAGDTGDVKVTRIKVRAYGCDDTDDGVGNNATAGVQCFEDTTGVDTGNADSWESEVGNFEAKNLISTITLYKGNDVLGSKSLKIVDAGNNGYTAGTDYYEADFDGLNLAVLKGSTASLRAEVQLLNTITGVKYFALDVNPADITAEDSQGDDIIPAGDLINGDIDKNPMMTIGATGTLTAFFEGSPDADILVMGTNDNAVSRFRFAATDEAFKVNRLTIMNDDDGADFDSPFLSPAVSGVTIKYKDQNNVTQTVTQPLTGSGIATFQGLNLWVPADGETFVDVFANVSSQNPEVLSGQPIRLGLQNKDNTINTFEAIGQSSSLNEKFNDGDEVNNVNDVDTFVVRRTKPAIQNVGPNTGALQDGTRDLLPFSIKADAKGSLGLARMVFNVNVNDDGNGGVLTLSDFRFKVNGNALSDSDVNIRTTADADLTPTGGAAITANSTVIVSFDEEQTVGAGATTNFILQASVANSTVDDTVDTRLAIGDENTSVSGIINNGTCTTNPSSNGQGNAGRIYDSVANCGLFGVTPIHFRTVAATARNFIWSDKSKVNAPVHVYPTVAVGSVTAGSGSFDWTNGNLLNISDLSTHTLN